jgi:hypothetical protein
MADDSITAFREQARRLNDAYLEDDRRHGRQSSVLLEVDVPRLLAAVDAVLKRTVVLEHPTLGGMAVAALQIEIRDAIREALTGKEGSGDGLR